MKNKWKVILIALFMLPFVVFFPGCNCFNNNENVSLKVPTQYIVNFYTDSEETFNIPIQTIDEGGLVNRPDNPEKTGYSFVGWFKDKELTIVWRFGLDTVKSNMTLYAKWRKFAN